jgi:MFS family permease
MLSLDRQAFIEALAEVRQSRPRWNRFSRSTAATRRHRPRRDNGPSRTNRPVGIRLGLRENAAQFTLLVVVNAFVGAMVGMERSILPSIAEHEFQLVARTAILSFIMVFGVSKALTNYLAGRFADRLGRKQILVAGWLVAVPVPFMLMWGPSWNWILAANALLGISQGFTWSTTVIMKIDLVGPARRGLAMGLNEFAGYAALGAAALATGWIAARTGLRPEPFYPGVIFVALGLGLSFALVRETSDHVVLESTRATPSTGAAVTDVFWRTTWSDRHLSTISQVGLVNNLNDGMAWGPVSIVLLRGRHEPGPHRYARRDLPGNIGALDAGHRRALRSHRAEVADRRRHVDSGRRHRRRDPLAHVCRLRLGAVLLGIGTAMVYPTLLAAIGDVAQPHGARRPLACIASGAILAMPSARCLPVSRRPDRTVGRDVDRCRLSRCCQVSRLRCGWTTLFGSR